MLRCAVLEFPVGKIVAKNGVGFQRNRFIIFVCACACYAPLRAVVGYAHLHCLAAELNANLHVVGQFYGARRGRSVGIGPACKLVAFDRNGLYIYRLFVVVTAQARDAADARVEIACLFVVNFSRECEFGAAELGHQLSVFGYRDCVARIASAIFPTVELPTVYRCGCNCRVGFVGVGACANKSACAFGIGFGGDGKVGAFELGTEGGVGHIGCRERNRTLRHTRVVVPHLELIAIVRHRLDGKFCAEILLPCASECS